MEPNQRKLIFCAYVSDDIKHKQKFGEKISTLFISVKLFIIFLKSFQTHSQKINRKIVSSYISEHCDTFLEQKPNLASFKGGSAGHQLWQGHIFFLALS